MGERWRVGCRDIFNLLEVEVESWRKNVRDGLMYRV